MQVRWTYSGCVELFFKYKLIQDLTLSWAGKLPLPDLARGDVCPSDLPLRLISLISGILSFFLVRGVEVVLYKGRERRSGPNAGLIDRQLPTYDDDSYSDLSSSDFVRF